MEKRRVLLVDDEDLFVSSVRDHLSLEYPDLEVETAADGREALDLLEAGDIDLVATNVRMPDRDGLGLLAYITSFGLKIPVIVLSASITAELVEAALASGALAVLGKPVDLGKLSRAIEDGLEGVGAGKLKGISLTGFLQLLQMELKTCRLDIRFGLERAVLYFSRGELIHAVKGELVGDLVMEEVVAWDAVEIRMQGDPWLRPRTIEKPLTHLLLDSAKAVDERFRSGLEQTESVPSLVAPASPLPSPSPSVADAGQLLEETLWNLGALRGLTAAALVRSDDGRLWTLGSMAGGNLEDAVRSCATALEAQELVLDESRGKAEPIQEVMVNLSGVFLLIHRLGCLGVLLTIFEHEKANLSLARRAMAEAIEHLESALAREWREVIS